MSRENSTLSAVLRSAYDGTPLGRAVAAGGGTVVWHHVGLVGQVTPGELRDKLNVAERANGFANRFLWIAVRQHGQVPFAGHPRKYLPPDVVTRLGAALADVTTTATLTLSSGAEERWRALYVESIEESARRFGILRALTSRSLTQLVRLATVYALLDRSRVVDEVHVAAAEALVRYSTDSIKYVWRASTGDPEADALLAGLRAEGPVSWIDLRDYGLRGAEAERVVQLLVDFDLVVVKSAVTRGRPRRFVEAR